MSFSKEHIHRTLRTDEYVFCFIIKLHLILHSVRHPERSVEILL